MGPLSQEHQEYLDKALQAGTMHKQDMVLVVMVSKLLEKPVYEVQDLFMDASIGVQLAFKRMAGIAEERYQEGVKAHIEQHPPRPVIEN